MKNLSLLTALMFSSSVVYAAGDWTYHKFNSNTEAYTPAPKYSCLEMWCENDCVENTKTGEGECCPEPVEGENCLTGQYNEKGCLTHKPKQCPQGESCQPDGQCATNMHTCHVIGQHSIQRINGTGTEILLTCHQQYLIRCSGRCGSKDRFPIPGFPGFPEQTCG